MQFLVCRVNQNSVERENVKAISADVALSVRVRGPHEGLPRNPKGDPVLKM